MIRYPKPLQRGDRIAVTAPSSGVPSALHPRLDIALDHLRSLGFEVVEGQCLRSNHKGISASQEARARELQRFFADPTVSLIFPPWGGSRLNEILPLLDFAELGQTPKWVQGFSDTSTFLLPLTLTTGMASAHSCNLIDFVPRQKDDLTRPILEHLAVKTGQSFVQGSSQFWQKSWPNYQADPGVPYQLTEKTQWKILDRSATSTRIEGRFIGGCLDTLIFLVGTKFGDVPGFVRRHHKEGVILYLENSSQSPGSVQRHLFNLKHAGWFDGIRGLLLGRMNGKDGETADDYTYFEALWECLGDLGFPVLYDLDIGHVVPQMTLINGALGEVFYERGQGWIKHTLC